mmetsp:Transcript_18402/g.46290  ORF Transcript_18402/g.46290 Transcript_18402/m.46290 type:complete len:608 (-) Transcript_18402:357-2180(-)
MIGEIHLTFSFEKCRYSSNNSIRPGTNTLVKDDLVDTIMLSLDNFVRPEEDPMEKLPRQTHLALMQPYMRNAHDDRGRELFLRCDNPQCVVLFRTEAAWLAAKEGLPHPAEQEDAGSLRAKGNHAFTNSHFYEGNQLYSRALEHPKVSENDYVACTSNRAETYLRQEQWELAERDCPPAVLEVQPTHVRCRFRLARALVQLEKFPEAKTMVSDLMSEHPADIRAVKELHVDIQRLSREKSGSYDIRGMIKEVKSNRRAFHASFVSDAVALGVEIPKADIGSYRGCLASENIGEGALLCASKAFCFVPPSAHDLQTEMDLRWGILSEGSQSMISAEAVLLLSRRPILGELLYSLSCSGDYSKQSDLEKINLARIHDIVSCNAFGSQFEDEMSVDLAKINGGESAGSFEANRLLQGGGICLNESLFNHSCVANCSWSLVGDHMFIHSTRAIAKGEELCIRYRAGSSFEDTGKAFRNWGIGGGFQCLCSRCTFFSSNHELVEMEDEVEFLFQSATGLVSRLDLPMGVAAERSIPVGRRLEILSAFQDVEPCIKCNAVPQLEALQGAYLSQKGDVHGALECYKRAAEASYSGLGATYGYAKQLWRIVGCSM